ncbi:hypothetical protein MMC19_006999 [Ptychographa xylographoides]|nr:hypothetical protein [Ptychographa xylographoides]
MKSWALLVFSSVLGLATAEKCNADNCLRAIRASAFPTRSGTADCSSYFLTTVTTAETTVTQTVTVTGTPTEIDSVVATTTVDVTATTVVEETATIVDVETITLPADLSKRQATETPSNIPTYASACSGSVRYSSACSCIGVTASTTTVAASTVTVTESSTVTPTGIAGYTTVSTEVVTVTDSTTAITTTDATVTVTSTSTVAPTPQPTFVLVADNGPFQGQYAFVGIGGYINFTATALQATEFTISPSGMLETLSQEAYYNVNVGLSTFIIVNTAAFATEYGGIPIYCAITSTLQLSCQDGLFTDLGICETSLAIFETGDNPATDCGGTYITLNVVLVPV